MAQKIHITEIVVIESFCRGFKAKTLLLTVGNTLTVGSGTPNIIALELFTAYFPEKLQLFLRLHSLCQGTYSYFLCHIHNRTDDFSRLFTAVL